MKFVRIFALLTLCVAILRSEAAIVHGIALDSEGEPVFSSPVTFQGKYTWLLAWTDVNGAFTIEVEPGIYIVSAGPAFSWRALLSPPARQIVVCDEELEINFEFSRVPFPRRINGHLLSGRTGEGLSTSISAQTRLSDQTVYVSTFSDATGDFSLPAFAGDWTVSVNGSTALDEIAPSVDVVVTQNEDAQIVLTTPVADRGVSFQIVDEIANPVANVSLTLSMETNGVTLKKYVSGITNGIGSSVLFDGRWNLEAYNFESNAFMTVIVSSTNTNFLVILRPYTVGGPPYPPPPIPATWGGHLWDHLGAPLTNFMIGDSSGAQTNSDANGAFTLQTAAGIHRLNIIATNFLCPSSQFWVTTNFVETNAQVVLFPAESILNVRVIDLDGNAIPVTSIVANTYTNGWLYSQTADTDCAGLAALQLFPGDWKVHIQTPSLTNREAVSLARTISIIAGTNHASFRVDRPAREIDLMTKVVKENGELVLYSPIDLISLNWDEDYFSYFPQAGPLSPGRWRASLWGRTVSLDTALTFDLTPPTTATNLTLVQKRGTNSVQIHIPNAQTNDEFVIAATTAQYGTNYSAQAWAFGTNDCILKLFEGEWEFSVTHVYSNYYSFATYTNFRVSDLGKQFWIARPTPLNEIALEGPATVRARVVDENGDEWPLLRALYPEFLSDDPILARGVQNIYANHPLFPFGVTVPLSACTEEGSIVLPRNLVAVDCALLDSESNSLSANFAAFARNGATNLHAGSWRTENGHRLLYLSPGDWTLYNLNNGDINARGFQMFADTKIHVGGPTNFIFVANPLTENRRTPSLGLTLSPTNIQFTIWSEIQAQYLVQESEDLHSWRTTMRFVADGQQPPLLQLNSRSNTFYRAVWFQDGFY